MSQKTGKPRQKVDYRLEILDNEILLFHPAETRIIYCNPTASLVWQLCNGRRSLPEIVELLRRAYPEAAETMAGDVEAALQQFVEHGAIEFV